MSLSYLTTLYQVSQRKIGRATFRAAHCSGRPRCLPVCVLVPTASLWAWLHSRSHFFSFVSRWQIRLLWFPSSECRFKNYTNSWTQFGDLHQTELWNLHLALTLKHLKFLAIHWLQMFATRNVFYKMLEYLWLQNKVSWGRGLQSKRGIDSCLTHTLYTWGQCLQCWSPVRSDVGFSTVSNHCSRSSRFWSSLGFRFLKWEHSACISTFVSSSAACPLRPSH